MSKNHIYRSKLIFLRALYFLQKLKKIVCHQKNEFWPINGIFEHLNVINHFLTITLTQGKLLVEKNSKSHQCYNRPNQIFTRGQIITR